MLRQNKPGSGLNGHGVKLNRLEGLALRTVGKTTDDGWTPGKEPEVNTTFGLAAQRVHSSTIATSQIRNDTVRVVREERSSAHPIRLDRITTQAMDMDLVKLLGQVKEIKLTAALPVVPVAKVGPRTAAEHLTKFTVERRRRETRGATLQGLISVSRAKLEMDRFTTTVPIRQARVFYIRRKTM